MLQKVDQDRLDKVLRCIELWGMRFPVAKISKDMGKSKGEVSAYLSGKKPMSDNFYGTFMALFGESSPSAEPTYLERRKEQKNNNDRKRTIPLYDAEATGSNTGLDMTPISAPAGTIDVGDLLHDSESAIRIYGNSMLPNYPPGCVVGLASITDSFIQPGEVYVIETADNQRLLKRLFYKEDDPDSDVISCYSDNTMKFDGGARHGKIAYPPFNIRKTDVRKIFIVTGVIKRNTNSIIINRN